MCLMRLWRDVAWVVQDCFHQPTRTWAFGETVRVKWVNLISSREALACASVVRCHTDRFVSFLMGQSHFQSRGSGMCLCRTLSYWSVRFIALSLVVSSPLMRAFEVELSGRSSTCEIARTIACARFFSSQPCLQLVGRSCQPTRRP